MSSVGHGQILEHFRLSFADKLQRDAEIIFQQDLAHYIVFLKNEVN